MWRFFQPTCSNSNRVLSIVRSTQNKDSVSSSNHVTVTAAAAAVATSAAVILTTTAQCPMNNKKDCDNTSNTQLKQQQQQQQRRFNSSNYSSQSNKNNNSNSNNPFIKITKTIMGNNNNVIQCEEGTSTGTSKSKSTTPSSKPPGENNMDSNITFRQRRLTMNTSGGKDEDDDNNHNEKSNDEKNKNIHNNITAQKYNIPAMRIMYSTEFEQSKAQNLSTQDNTTNNIQQTIHQEPPFPPHQVGTYSCHGVEPHPYIVYTKEEKTMDQSALSFFDRIFGNNNNNLSSSSTNNYSQTSAKVITIAEQKINQDRGHIIYPFGNQECGQTALFGVFDGHGECGEMLAEYTMNAVCEKLHSHPSCSVSGDGGKSNGNTATTTTTSTTTNLKVMEQAFMNIFQEIDNEVKNKEHFKPTHSGTTACVVFLRGDTVWVANVGDSRAVLGQSIQHSDKTNSKLNKKGHSTVAVDWSKDQNPNDEEERLRVIQSGGFVTMPQEEGLPARIWLDEQCSQIGLAMSRSIGDHALKDVGVIAEPKVYEYKIGDNDEFFIIASDGVWEFISSKEAVTIIQSCFDNGMGANEACEVLIKEAMNKWKEKEGDYRDDITAIIVRLRDLWGQEKG